MRQWRTFVPDVGEGFSGGRQIVSVHDGGKWLKPVTIATQTKTNCFYIKTNKNITKLIF